MPRPMNSGNGTHPAAPHALPEPDRSDLSCEGSHITSAPVPPAVAGHGFLTATEILALLLQLDVDATIAALNGAPGLASAPSDLVAVPTGQRHERRSGRRLEPQQLVRDLRLTIPGVPRVRLVNISETGVLVETSSHASLGKTVELFVWFGGRGQRVRARTVRSNLSTIKPGSGVVYRTALRFEHRLSLEDLLRP